LYFIAKVKEYNKIMPIKEAIDVAVEYAISHNYNVTQEATIEQLIAQFALSPEEANELVNLLWK